MRWINWLYIIFLGIILSITTGFGLAAFYPQPIQPSYSITPAAVAPQNCYATSKDQNSPDCQAALQKQQLLQQQQEASQQAYMNANAGYTRTAVFFGIVIGSLFAVIGIGLIKTSKLVANGLLLAAVSTAILARLLIRLASLGASTTGTNGPDTTAYTEFFALLILSVVVILVGLFRLSEEGPAVAKKS